MRIEWRREIGGMRIRVVSGAENMKEWDVCGGEKMGGMWEGEKKLMGAMISCEMNAIYTLVKCYWRGESPKCRRFCQGSRPD